MNANATKSSSNETVNQSVRNDAVGQFVSSQTIQIYADDIVIFSEDRRIVT